MSSEPPTVNPSPDFNVIFDAALATCHEHTGVDLSRSYPLAEKLQNCQSADDILELLQEKANEFKDFRNGNHKLIDCLRPVVQVLHAFSGVLNNVVGLHLPPSDHFLTSLPMSRPHSNQQMSYSMVSIFFSPYVSSLLFFRLFPYPSHVYHFRPQSRLGRVMTPWPNYSNALQISLVVSVFTSRSHSSQL